MASPAVVNFLELVVTDVKILQLGHLEGWHIRDLVVGDIKPLEVGEELFLSENGESFNLVFGKVEEH